MMLKVGTLAPTSILTVVTTAKSPPLHPPGTQTRSSSSQSTSTSPRLLTPPTFSKQQKTSSSYYPTNKPSIFTLPSLLGPLSSTPTYKLHRSFDVLSRHHPPLHPTFLCILATYPPLFRGCAHHHFRGWIPFHFQGCPPQPHIVTQLYTLSTINHTPSLPPLPR